MLYAIYAILDHVIMVPDCIYTIIQCYWCTGTGRYGNTMFIFQTGVLWPTSLAVHYLLEDDTQHHLLLLWEIYLGSNIPDGHVHGANMGPIWGRWAPCWPHELCYLGCYSIITAKLCAISLVDSFILLIHENTKEMYNPAMFIWLEF